LQLIILLDKTKEIFENRLEMTSSETSASAFSSSDTAALERQTETEHPVTFEQIWNENHSKKSVDWIRENSYKRVCIWVIFKEP